MAARLTDVLDYGLVQSEAKRDTLKYLRNFEKKLAEKNYELAEHCLNELSFSAHNVGPESPCIRIWIPQLRRRIVKARYKDHLARASKHMKNGDFEQYAEEHDRATECIKLMSDLDALSSALSERITGSLEPLEPLFTRNGERISLYLERLQEA